MLSKIHTNTKDIHQPFSSYTHCVEVISPSRFLFCSGQVPATKDGQLLSPDDFDAQGKLVLENIKSVLSNSGAELTDIVRLVTYLCRE